MKSRRRMKYCWIHSHHKDAT